MINEQIVVIIQQFGSRANLPSAINPPRPFSLLLQDTTCVWCTRQSSSPSSAWWRTRLCRRTASWRSLTGRTSPLDSPPASRPSCSASCWMACRCVDGCACGRRGPASGCVYGCVCVHIHVYVYVSAYAYVHI